MINNVIIEHCYICRRQVLLTIIDKIITFYGVIAAIVPLYYCRRDWLSLTHFTRIQACASVCVTYWTEEGMHRYITHNDILFQRGTVSLHWNTISTDTSNLMLPCFAFQQRTAQHFGYNFPLGHVGELHNTSRIPIPAYLTLPRRVSLDGIWCGRCAHWVASRIIRDGPTGCLSLFDYFLRKIRFPVDILSVAFFGTVVISPDPFL